MKNNKLHIIYFQNRIALGWHPGFLTSYATVEAALKDYKMYSKDISKKEYKRQILTFATKNI